MKSRRGSRLAAWLKNFHPGYALFALLIAVLLWVLAHSEAPIERAYSLPVVTANLPPHLTLLRQSAEHVNIRVLASQPLLARIDERALHYEVDLSGSAPGRVRRPIERSVLGRRLPQGVEIANHFPASIAFELERKQTRDVRVRPELRGDPAPGFRIEAVRATPPRIRLTGARSEIAGLRAIATEVVDIEGARESLRRPVLLPVAEARGWLETFEQVEVHVEIVPVQDAGATLQEFAP